MPRPLPTNPFVQMQPMCKLHPCSRTLVPADLFQVRADLLKLMFGALIAQGGLIVALVKLL